MPFIITIMLKSGMMHGSVLLVLHSPGAERVRSRRVRPVTSLLLRCIKGREQKTRCSFSVSFHSQAPVSRGFKYQQLCKLYRKEALGGHCLPQQQEGSSPHPSPRGSWAPGALWPPEGQQAGSGDPPDKMHGEQHSPLVSAPG